MFDMLKLSTYHPSIDPSWWHKLVRSGLVIMNQQLVESLAQIITSLSSDDRELLEAKIKKSGINEQALPSRNRRIPGQDQGQVIHDDFKDPLPSEVW
jgi:hypothetical protein